MTKASKNKKLRHEKLLDIIDAEPFLTDEDIARRLDVSIPTVRLDRLELGIHELRERIKDMARRTQEKVRSLGNKDIVGELLDLDLNERGVAVFDTTKEMAFERSDIVRGHFIYAFAESTAISVIDADVALVGVANIKYKVPVHCGDKLVAKAEVKRIRTNNFVVWVLVYRDRKEVFRGKFILITI
ncbi:MAG: transcription factor FapR [Clostridia bacterium]